MMSQMLDLIRNSQVPSNLMQSAARGALAVPPEETIEILVYLALNHKLFGEQARLTLAGWDEKGRGGGACGSKDQRRGAGVFRFSEESEATPGASIGGESVGKGRSA